VTAADEQGLHPRPQLCRQPWLDLCGEWAFEHDDGDVGLHERWQDRPECFPRTILVPYPPESSASGIGETGPHPVVWYRRTFDRQATGLNAQRDRLWLYLNAVDYEAMVWVNGHLVTSHRGGHTPFSVDVTEALLPGDSEQTIVVRASDPTTDLTQPRGKQFWEDEPRRIWYHRTTGIWQPVWMEALAQDHISDVRWSPDPDTGLLGLQVSLSRTPQRPLRLRVRLTLRDDVLADETYMVQAREIRRAVGIEPAVGNIGRARLLWAPAHPNLIDAVLTLEDDERVIDRVQSYAGLRSVGVSGGVFELNGMPTYLRLVLDQGYRPQTHLAAADGAGLRREVELVKSLGFNGVRIHQKVEDPRFLYWCDRLGLMVWGEMANAYAFSNLAIERMVDEWMEVLRRDVSHPCIVTWVPFNESWGVPNLPRDPAQRAYVRSLYHLTKALDPSRPVIANDGWEHIVSDLWGIHDYALRGDAIRERYGSFEALERTLRLTQPSHHAIALQRRQHHEEPVVLSECGGLSYDPRPERRRFGYGTVNDPAELVARYEDLIGAILESPSIAGFCYTQLTDTEQETNGLLFDDHSPKVDPAALRAINERPSRAIPGDAVMASIASTEMTGFSSSGGTD